MDRCLHLDVMVYIYPTNGVWTSGDTRRIVRAAQQVASLQDIDLTPEGFMFPSNADATACMKKMGLQSGAPSLTMAPRQFYART
jgi:hypothetical protein